MCQDTKKYNGWTNYETWNVKLWMDNDQGSHEYWNEQAQEAYNRSEADDYNTREEIANYALSNQLKDEHENAMHDMLDAAKQSASMWADLLGAALSEVNWQEIAENMLEDVEKES